MCFVPNYIRIYLYLLQNVPIRLGPQEFSCPICPKIHQRKDVIQKHILTHTGEKPFKCPYCTKNFTQESSRLRHIKYQHQLKE